MIGPGTGLTGCGVTFSLQVSTIVDITTKIVILTRAPTRTQWLCIIAPNMLYLYYLIIYIVIV